MKNILLIFTLLFISCDSDDPVSPGSGETFDYTYNLEDLNPTSSYYQEYVGPASFPNQITIHYLDTSHEAHALPCMGSLMLYMKIYCQIMLHKLSLSELAKNHK